MLFREPPLVGALHAASRAAAPACWHCFRHIDSVELQIARRILATAAAAEQDDAEQPDGRGDGNSGGEPSKSARQTDDSRGDRACKSADAHASRAEALRSVDAVLLEGLLNGCERLPYSAQFPLPAVVPCPAGCDDKAYCSAACSQAAWNGYHRLLCTGPAAPGEPDAGPESGGDAAAAGDEPRRKRSKRCPERVHGDAHPQHEECSLSHQSGAERDGRRGNGAAEAAVPRREALAEFNAHADATNDIFRVAARLVAGVLLRASSALLRGETVSSPICDASAAGVYSDGSFQSAAEHRSPALAQSAKTAQHGGEPPDPEPGACWAALQQAWLPHAVAWKAVWWDAVALPPDVSDEAAFRQGRPKNLFSPLQASQH